MCMICKNKDVSVSVIVETNDRPFEFKICPACAKISESYYLILCENCKTNSWTLAGTIKDMPLKGKRFTFLYTDSCIACIEYNFIKAQEVRMRWVKLWFCWVLLPEVKKEKKTQYFKKGVEKTRQQFFKAAKYAIGGKNVKKT